VVDTVFELAFFSLLLVGIIVMDCRQNRGQEFKQNKLIKKRDFVRRTLVKIGTRMDSQSLTDQHLKSDTSDIFKDCIYKIVGLSYEKEFL